MKEEYMGNYVPIHPVYSMYTVSIGSLLGIADHTCVYIEHANLPAGGCECPCYGRDHTDAEAVERYSFQGDDIWPVAAMVNLVPTKILPTYNRVYHNCGILYGIEGVCHNMTNRILVTAGGRPILFGENVKGYVMSSILYGIFGTTGMPFFLRMILADQIADVMSVGERKAEKISELPFFDPVIYQKKKLQLEEMIKGLKDIKGEKYENAMKRLLEMEVFAGISTPENRLITLYQMWLYEGKSDSIQTDYRLKTLVKSLNQFTDVLKQGGNINTEFQKMHKEMREILGSDYKELFLEEYDENLILVEESYITQ